MDLAGFNNYNNLGGGMTQVQGEHQFKTVQNQKEGNFNVLDHKAGLASTFGNTNNMGNMNVSGNHQFDKTQNSGNFVAAPRTFNPDGSPVKMMLMDLASFNQMTNQEGGQAVFEGTHAIKQLQNDKKGYVNFKDNKQGQFVTVG
jgi:hypothetical protein